MFDSILGSFTKTASCVHFGLAVIVCLFQDIPAINMVHLSSLLLKQYHGGYVVIRFARAGHNQPNRPFYRIVAAFNKKARDGKYLEQLGTYDPLPNIHNEKLVSFNFDRIKYWIGCGAHPSKSVCKLLGMYSLAESVSFFACLSICPFFCSVPFLSV
ncbi:S ribosomal protein S16%2C mitochondrial isoform X1 [Xyrichtys novacula]|uniref:Small ribosomal subunit protein bS16m n=1 Tax=Xyrichtys novacula TaxID=13765 RepID=A0AAV1EP67_XYRNO|nr:S ribosomal protein S16%2C mitochondrial isoform X1 [Xyrichtys novacula]